jgi:ABC-type sugar transport system permease subunit
MEDAASRRVRELREVGGPKLIMATDAATSARPRVRTRRRRTRRVLWPYAFAAPAVALLGLVYGYPLVAVIRDSFYGGTFSNLTYVGLANYKGVIEDPVFITSLLNNLKLLITVPIMTALALLIAVLLYDAVRGWRQYRAIVFLPYILPATGMGLAFSYLLQRNGVVNTILGDVGLSGVAPDWLGSAKVVVFSIGGIVIWQQLGLGVVVFTARLMALPQEVTEAGMLDGANWWQLRRRVILPQIRETIEFFMVLEAITVMSFLFTYVFVLTGGGPGNASSVMDLYIWKNGFAQGAVGIAAAVAVLMLLMASVLMAVYYRLRLRHNAS